MWYQRGNRASKSFATRAFRAVVVLKTLLSCIPPIQLSWNDGGSKLSCSFRFLQKLPFDSSPKWTAQSTYLAPRKRWRPRADKGACMDLDLCTYRSHSPLSLRVGRKALAKVYTGQCLCGTIQFKARGPANKPHTCSCSMCQRHTGSLTVAWVEFPKDAVSWTGPGGVPSTYRSSDYSSRAFCANCGSALGAIDDAPVVALVLGVFDKPKVKELMPTSHAFRAGRPRWWHIDTAHASE